MLFTTNNPVKRVSHNIIKSNDDTFIVEFICLITGRTTIEKYVVPLTKREIEAEYDYISFPLLLQPIL